jgi:signal transduction histidine kinase
VPVLTVPESIERARLAATFRTCRALRHELATPLAAAALHLEVARRAAAGAGDAVPGKTRDGILTAAAKLEEMASLLDVLTALGEARAGEPAIVDFGALVARGARAIRPQLDALGLRLRESADPGAVLVAGFEDELENAVREALLAASRLAAGGEARLLSGAREGTAFFSFRAPLGSDGPADALFRPCGRAGAGYGPFLARWSFEAHGGRLEASDEAGFVTVSGRVPQVRS